MSAKNAKIFTDLSRTPERDWRFIVAGFILLLCLAIAGSFYIYSQIDTGEIFLVDKKPAEVTANLNKFELEKAVEEMRRKEKESLLLLQEMALVPDPSVSRK